MCSVLTAFFTTPLWYALVIIVLGFLAYRLVSQIIAKM